MEITIKIELTEEQYKNTHLLLHNLIELSDNLSSQNQFFSEMSISLKNIKTTLEVK